MDSHNSRQASDLIWQAWQTGAVIPQLPEAVRPRTRVEGYAIQAHLEQHSPKPIAGWKIAATSLVGQKHIGVDGPIAGRILAERSHPNGTTVSLAGNRMRVAEPEFAFRIGKSITPRATPYSVDEALDHVAALHPALEIPDSRFDDYVKVGAAQLIADNACAHEFVLGEAVDAGWRNLDLASYPVKATIDGRLDRDGIGSNVLGDPRLALAWIVNELSQIGITLQAGHIITTGTCMQPLDIVPGDRVRADFGRLGKVAAQFA